MTRILSRTAATAIALALAACATGASGPAEPIAQAAMNQPAPSAADYLRMAAASDQYEIRSSQLVLETTQDDDLRRFARMMIDHHTATTATLTAAARSEGMTPPPPALDAAKTAMVREIEAAAGPARDQIYQDQQVTAHREALALHASFAHGAPAGALKAAAGAAVPIVSRHYNQIVSLADPMSAPGTQR